MGDHLLEEFTAPGQAEAVAVLIGPHLDTTPYVAQFQALALAKIKLKPSLTFSPPV